MTPAKREKRPEAVNDWPKRDVRHPAKSDVIIDAVAAAARALEPFEKERLWTDVPEGYAALRRMFACLSDDERRRVLVAFLQDEGRRIQHDRTASFNGVA